MYYGRLSLDCALWHVAVGMLAAFVFSRRYTVVKLRRIWFGVTALTLAVVMTGGHSNAGSIPGLFNTGVDDAGTPLNRGDTDPHWNIVVNPDPRFVAPAAAVTTDLSSAAGWVSAGDTAKWVSIVERGSTFIAPGTYVFETTFDLTGLDPSNAQIYGSFLVDNTVTDVLLNGNSTGLSGGEWTSSTAFSISDGFVPGQNTLTFMIQNRTPGMPNTPGGIAVLFDLPFDRVSLSPDGQPYLETFDEALGINGRARGTILPQG